MKITTIIVLALLTLNSFADDEGRGLKRRVTNLEYTVVNVENAIVNLEEKVIQYQNSTDQLRDEVEKLKRESQMVQDYRADFPVDMEFIESYEKLKDAMKVFTEKYGFESSQFWERPTQASNVRAIFRTLESLRVCIETLKEKFKVNLSDTYKSFTVHYSKYDHRPNYFRYDDEAILVFRNNRPQECIDEFYLTHLDK